MPNIITEGKLEGHKITIKGPQVNEAFYVYGGINVQAVKDFLANAETPRATRKPRRARRTAAAEAGEQRPPQSAPQDGQSPDDQQRPTPRRNKRALWPENEPAREPAGAA